MEIIRAVMGIVAVLIAWFFVATAGNPLLRVSWPGYARAEKPLKFTLGMMAARLVLGALSSVSAGFVVAWVTKSNGMAAKVLGLMLVAAFIPAHYAPWDKFPVCVSPDISCLTSTAQACGRDLARATEC